MENAWKSALRAVMYGHAVADALGVPVEFRSRRELHRDPVVGMRGFGTHGMPAGTWSDDTSMSLAALDVLADGTPDYRAVMENFLRWYREGAYTATGRVFDVGITCVNVLGEFAADPSRDAVCYGHGGEHSNGNGSLMRIHPFALYLYANGRADERSMDVIHNASCLTHAHERSQMACGIYTFVLWELLADPSREAVLRGLDRAQLYYAMSSELSTYDRLLTRIGREPIAREDIGSSGYVVDTLEAAIYCLLETDSYRDCVLAAVNLGEDTDTVAAVAGGLAGAMYGYEAIPAEWRDQLLHGECIEAMCARAAENWRASDETDGSRDALGVAVATPHDAPVYDLGRFVKAQELNYERAFDEVRDGRKTTHWMWYIFPQIQGLGYSPMAKAFGIVDLGEARAYLAHPILSERLIAICEALLDGEGNDPIAIFGRTDAMKLRSSMTLFALVSDADSIFHRVLDRFYGGDMDDLTLSRVVQLDL